MYYKFSNLRCDVAFITLREVFQQKKSHDTTTEELFSKLLFFFVYLDHVNVFVDNKK